MSVILSKTGTVEEGPDGLLIHIVKHCFICQKRNLVKVPVDGLILHQTGSLVQNAFPDLTVDEREAYMTGIHAACWETLNHAGPDYTGGPIGSGTEGNGG